MKFTRLCITVCCAIACLASVTSAKASFVTSSSLPSSSFAITPKRRRRTKVHRAAAAAGTKGNVQSNRPVTLPRGGEGSLASAVLKRLELGAYFALWYALNIVYNILNKKVLNILPAPLTVGTIQFGVGALYAALLWILRLRPTPTLTASGRTAVYNIGVSHAAGQLASMISLGAGPVSFTHIVKALEPVFSALVSGIVLKEWLSPFVYLTLIPVIGGVGYACLKERSFSTTAFLWAMASNLAFAIRAVSSKTAMTNPIGTNITSTNLFAMVTMASFVLSIPFCLMFEGWGSFIAMWKTATMDVAPSELIYRVVLSGLFHYGNNEVMYQALSKVHPVTLAVGNTMKRVFIMVASVMVFRNPVSMQAGIGSAVGIGGVLLYSIVKAQSERKPAKVVPIDKRALLLARARSAGSTMRATVASARSNAASKSSASKMVGPGK